MRSVLTFIVAEIVRKSPINCKMLALRMKSLTRMAIKLPRIGNTRANQYRFGSTVKFYFLEESSGNKVEVNGTIGKTLLDIALENDVDIEGACGGELACSTCHVVVEPDLYEKLPAKKVEEDDMLDLAWGITDTYVCYCYLACLLIFMQVETLLSIKGYSGH